jgi:hypothetical protein
MHASRKSRTVRRAIDPGVPSMFLGRALWIAASLGLAAVAANYAWHAANTRLQSRRVLGPAGRESRLTLQRLVDVSRQGNRMKFTRLLLLYAGVGAFVVALAAREWLGLIIAATPFILVWWMNIRMTTLPAVLLLGTSTHTSLRRQRDVKRRLSPLRVVSLLDVDIPWDSDLADEMLLDCYRTRSEADWWPVITGLMDIAPVIAIDAAAETPGVLREGSHILRTELVHKCLFLTPPDGSAPILDRLLPSSGVERRKLRVARYEEAPTALVAMIAGLDRPKVTADRRLE